MVPEFQLPLDFNGRASWHALCQVNVELPADQDERLIEYADDRRIDVLDHMRVVLEGRGEQPTQGDASISDEDEARPYEPNVVVVICDESRRQSLLLQRCGVYDYGRMARLLDTGFDIWWET